LSIIYRSKNNKIIIHKYNIMDLNYSLTWSLTCFIILTLGYTILKSFFNPKTPEDESKKNYGGIILLMYMLITLIAQIISNFSNAKAVCQGSGQPFLKIFLYTLIPYFFIFGSIVLMINIKKGWLNPFSNTIGYVISMKLLKGGKSFNTIFNHYKNGGKDDEEDDDEDYEGDDDDDDEDYEGGDYDENKDKGPTKQMKLLEEICSDNSLLTNELSGDNYEKMMNSILPDLKRDFKKEEGEKAAYGSSKASTSGDRGPDNWGEDAERKGAEEGVDGEDNTGGKENELKKAYDSLFRMVLLKDVIAECVWLLLAGCLAITVQTNIITAIECDYDPATMKAIKKKAEDTYKANKKPVHRQNKVT
jgi:hypothetical protein